MQELYINCHISESVPGSQVPLGYMNINQNVLFLGTSRIWWRPTASWIVRPPVLDGIRLYAEWNVRVIPYGIEPIRLLASSGWPSWEVGYRFLRVLNCFLWKTWGIYQNVWFPILGEINNPWMWWLIWWGRKCIPWLWQVMIIQLAVLKQSTVNWIKVWFILFNNRWLQLT